LPDVIQRLNNYFDAGDAFFEKAGHNLDVFFSSGTQTKLATLAHGPALLSDTARYNLAASDEAGRLIEAAEARRTGTDGPRR
jgi:hypothetical protein